MDATKLAEKFWTNVEKSEGCWEWQGSKTVAGYGKFRVQQPEKTVMVYAHRLSYELAKGPIPEGLLIRHTCDNPKCVKPDHLLTGTKKDNARDMIERGRGYKQNRTHCLRGHEFTPENTINNKFVSGRTCIICKKEDAKKRQAAYRARECKKRIEKTPIVIPIPPNTLICMDCGILAPIATTTKSRCQPCQNARDREYRANNREMTNAHSRAYKARKRAEMARVKKRA